MIYGGIIMFKMYEFYIGHIADNGEVSVVGPYLKIADKYMLAPILGRADFAVDIDDLPLNVLSLETIKPEQREFLCRKQPDGTLKPKAMFMIYDEVFDMAENEGLVRGYVTLSELDEAIKNDYESEVVDGFVIHTPEMVAEMTSSQRSEYGHIAFIDRASAGYICRALIHSVDQYDVGMNPYETVFIVRER
jgi:hypothetical protein